MSTKFKSIIIGVLSLALVISLFAHYVIFKATAITIQDTMREGIELYVKNALLSNRDFVVSKVEADSEIDLKIDYKDIFIRDAFDEGNSRFRVIIECYLEGEGYITEEKYQVEITLLIDENNNCNLESAQIIDEKPIKIKVTDRGTIEAGKE